MSMIRGSTAVELEEIRSVVRQIVERFQPEKVILFGSHAYGAPSEDSDVDLLVVMNTAGNRLRAAADISAAVDHPFPIDILVYDPERLRESVARGGSFATEVTTRGIVLYEA